MSTRIASAFEKIQSEVMHEAVIYRPTLGKVAGSVTGAMFLERARYYALKVGRDFYKFNDKCQHDMYQDGDSWQEVLGMTRYEFETARKKVSTRVAKGDSKTELADVFTADGELSPKEHIILYWRDKNDVMWYRFNENLYTAHLLKAIDPELPNVEIQHYLAMRESNITYLMRESNITSNTKRHKETDIESIPESQVPVKAPVEEKQDDGLDKDFAAIRKELVDLGVLSTGYAKRLFQDDYDECKPEHWREAIKITKAEMVKQQKNLPYNYVVSCARSEYDKDKQQAFIKANTPVIPYHKPVDVTEDYSMSDAEAAAFAADMREQIEAMREKKGLSA